MKKFTPLRIVFAAILCFVFILACSKDFDKIIQDSFEFSFVSDNEEEIFVFEHSKTDFTLEPERVINTVQYFMKYSIENGRGYYLSPENDTIRENDTIAVTDFNMSFNYVAIDTGAHRVKVLAWDSNTLQKEIELSYATKFASFSFLLGKGTDDFIINSENPVNVTLLRDKLTGNPNSGNAEEFEVIYQLQNGTGTLYLDGKAYGAGTPFTLPKGVNEFGYKPETLGEHKLTMTATAPDGAKITNQLSLTVSNLAFIFRATASASQVELNTNLAVNIDLQTQDEQSDITYEISHSFASGSQGAGTVRDQNGGVMNPGTSRAIDPGNYNFTFQDDVLGQRKIYFDVLDSNGQTKRDSVEIEVANIPFTFSGNSVSNQVFVNQRTQFNFNIKSTGNTSNIDYNLSFNGIEGNGKVTGVNGNTIQNNTDYPVDLGNFSLFYTPETLGAHNISFIVTDNFGQEVGPVEIDLTANQLELDFSASANSNEVLVGQRGTISLSLIEKGDYDGVDYELSYFITGGAAALFNGNSSMPPSQFFTVNPGSFSYDFIGEQAGTYVINFLLRDSNGQTLEEKVTIVVGNNDFTVTMTPSKPTEFSNLPVNIVVNIDEIPDGANDTYQAFYSSSLNGQMVVNGATYGPGETFPLSAGITNITYTGSESGPHNLVLSTESGSDVTRTASTTITYDQVDFSFTGGATNTSISVGETTALNFNITESVGSSSYKMRFSLNGNAIIRDASGTIVSPGNIYDVPKGNFGWTVEGTDDTAVSLVFTAQNDTGLEKDVTISLQVAAKDYNFVASATESSANTEVPITANFNITEIGIGGDSYQMYYSSGSTTGSFEYNGTNYGPGETFDVPVGPFTGTYTGISAGNHNVNFTVRSSSDVTKTEGFTINFDVYEEPFTLNISQSSQDKYITVPFDLTAIVNATAGHEPSVTYTMKFTFTGASAGTIRYKGITYREGENIPLDFGSALMSFIPETEENFNIDITVENSTGQSQSVSEFVTMFKKPVVAAKGEKHNINCGGLNGCDYEVRIYTCFDANCSEAYNGSTIEQVEIRIFNRQDNRWDTKVFNYNDAKGDGVNRYFELEKEPSEGKLRYLDQDYEVRVRDSNGQWSESTSGFIVRV
jgi:hypothetical protein|tara:strand:+ start:1685 stop:5041 length:3357 start_codon:yes stop_codon:yes gene_type:complete